MRGALCAGGSGDQLVFGTEQNGSAHPVSAPPAALPPPSPCTPPPGTPRRSRRPLERRRRMSAIRMAVRCARPDLTGRPGGGFDRMRRATRAACGECTRGRRPGCAPDLVAEGHRGPGFRRGPGVGAGLERQRPPADAPPRRQGASLPPQHPREPTSPLALPPPPPPLSRERSGTFARARAIAQRTASIIARSTTTHSPQSQQKQAALPHCVRACGRAGTGPCCAIQPRRAAPPPLAQR